MRELRRLDSAIPAIDSGGLTVKKLFLILVVLIALAVPALSQDNNAPPPSCWNSCYPVTLQIAPGIYFTYWSCTVRCV